ncbi:MAG: dihydrolipoamide dehydrogenase [Candidatus Tokpelaia sp. JSC161]|jgi:dihydrolipoamide dehydrogenase|nr:MAG: dihydrolipoamide dehydrogenase [Candidatus Tokpelaia sp. JSC161]
MSKLYDIIIIGSGPGGYTAAIRAAQLGFSTAIVEREHLGGICLNWGCIPTKALLRSAEIKHITDHIKDYGIRCDGSVLPDINAIVARSRRVSARLNSGIAFLMKKNKIDIIWGEGLLKRSVTDGTFLEIIVEPSLKKVVEPQHAVPKGVLGSGVYKAKHVILATGARPRILPGLEPDGQSIWTYCEAMVPKIIPKSLIIVGSGAIGIEFSSFYRDMGASVTLIEVLPQIMPLEDCELSAFTRKELESRGISILTEAKITKLEKAHDLISVHIDVKGKKKSISAACLLSAVGVEGNVESLGIESLGIRFESGRIVTDQWNWTGVPGIYAIGDVSGAPMLAHKAEAEGRVCVETIAGLSKLHPVDKRKIPGCIYSRPQVASVGLTEEKAKDFGYNIRVGRYFFSANGKAIALGEDKGFIKTIFDEKTGQLLGAHMVGAEVTELIQGVVIAMNLETTEEDLIRSIFPHPTLSEVLKESVLDAYDLALNI